ncbi:MAG: hypothetical protein R3277_00975 [Brumimicrobium sp.]|nr:hypothetical protein [Brumimicrobium sp.]
MNKYLILVLFIFLAGGIFSQTKNEIIQQRIEFIAEELETEDISLEDVFLNLSYYYDHPLNLNAATKEELEQLLLLTDIQINNLLLHIEQHGKLISIYELQALKYWDMFTIENVLPFVKVDDKLDKLQISFRELLKEGKTELYLRWIRGLEEKQGYRDVPEEVLEESNSYYYGSPDRLYSRLRFYYRTNISVGVTMEKDAGEEFFGKTQPYGFDFYSAHAFYKGGKFLRKVAIGDYQMQVGQGVAFWTGYAFNKTADAVAVKKNARGLRQYTSVDETRFLRGAGVELGWKNFSLTTWASHKGIDGSLQPIDTLSGEDVLLASSFNLTGFHRTNSEIERKHSVMETILGANFKYETRNLQVGLSGVNQRYSIPLERDYRPYNQFEFKGSELTNLSVDYSYVLRNVNFFGEIARCSSSGSVAMIQSAVIALDPKASLSVLYRNYPKDYHTFYNAGFAESSRAINEEGFFIGSNFKLSDAWTINAYGDIFRFPWLAFRVDAPSEGHEFLGQVTYSPNRNLEVYARVREQMREQNLRDFEGNMRPIEEVLQRNYRLNLNYKISEAFRWKSRIEFVTYDRPSEERQTGFVIMQDLLFKPKNLPVDIAFRYAIFNTDSFDARIYAFESNIQNVFSIPAYFNDGSRAYILLRYSFLRRFDLWIRYAAFVYSNENLLGSGSEEIEGNTRSEIGVQLRIQL